MTAPTRRGIKPYRAAKLLEVLPLIAEGYTNARIGRVLGITEDTVKCRCRALFDDIGARDRAHAVAIGYQRGLLGPVTHRAQQARRDVADRHSSTCALLTPRVCDCPAGE